jgi:hypothetical protein
VLALALSYQPNTLLPAKLPRASTRASYNRSSGTDMVPQIAMCAQRTTRGRALGARGRGMWGEPRRYLRAAAAPCARAGDAHRALRMVSPRPGRGMHSSAPRGSHGGRALGSGRAREAKRTALARRGPGVSTSNGVMLINAHLPARTGACGSWRSQHQVPSLYLV